MRNFAHADQLEQAKRKIEKEHSEKKKVEERNAELNRELGMAQQHIAQLQAGIQEALGHNERSIGQLEKEISARQHAERKNEEMNRELGAKRAEIAKIREELARVEKQLQQKHIEAQELQTRLGQSQTLSQTRAHELRDAHSVLSVTSEPADLDVLRMINHLNETIFQCAAKLVETWTFVTETTDIRCNAHEKIIGTVGRGIADVLIRGQGDDSERQTATQIAIQAYFAAWACQTLSRWKLNEDQLQNSLSELYSGIRNNGETLNGCP